MMSSFGFRSPTSLRTIFAHVGILLAFAWVPAAQLFRVVEEAPEGDKPSTIRIVLATSLDAFSAADRGLGDQPDRRKNSSEGTENEKKPAPRLNAGAPIDIDVARGPSVPTGSGESTVVDPPVPHSAASLSNVTQVVSQRPRAPCFDSHPPRAPPAV